MNNLLKAYIHRMSKVTGTSLNETHYDILEFAYEYYQKNKVGPLYENIKKNTGASKEDIEELFPHGLNSVYTWVGIPIQSLENGCKPFAKIQPDDYREVYLDYNSTTPLRKEVVDFLKEFYSDPNLYGNPSSSSNLGEKSYAKIHEARVELARQLSAAPENIIFTSCGTESNNTAIKGIAFKYYEKKGHIICGKTEHSATLKAVKFLESLGYPATYVGVTSEGIVDPEEIEKSIRKDTILVALMAVNNEIGTVNPIAEVGKICSDRGIPFFVDAVQAYGKMKLRPKEMGISLLSMSGHKIYAPKGVGALYIDDYVSLHPLLHGGEQEFKFRGGTENVASIAAFGLASKLMHQNMERENSRLRGLQKYFIEELKKIEPGIIINGSLEKRLPNNISIGFPGIDSGSLLLSLNQIGVYVSAGSACSAGSLEASHVIKALGVDTNKYGIIRFSFGINTAKEDLDYLFKYLPSILEILRNDS
ncbi:MAG TPA: aminotransferase class V-fold PLP-dependent enzyme [Ignavibacteriales bacterium]|nr:aminotransferase class V-fold PLP-dependent enzyme [Ignavibacteriales bacterium]